MATLSVRLSDELLQALQYNAELDRRPVGQVVRMAIEQFLEHGLKLPTVPPPSPSLNGPIAHKIVSAETANDGTAREVRTFFKEKRGAKSAPPEEG